MEGRWGRRVYGRIWQEEPYTQFWLQVEMESGDIRHTNATVLSSNLRHIPGLYKQILDSLTEQLIYLLECS